MCICCYICPRTCFGLYMIDCVCVSWDWMIKSVHMYEYEESNINNYSSPINRFLPKELKGNLLGRDWHY